MVEEVKEEGSHTVVSSRICSSLVLNMQWSGVETRCQEHLDLRFHRVLEVDETRRHAAARGDLEKRRRGTRPKLWADYRVMRGHPGVTCDIKLRL
jgi:hypothetical protein